MAYAGTPIGTAPFNYTVYPSAPSAALSFFNLSIAPAVGSSSPHIDANAVQLSITTRDAFANRVYWGTDVYAISFAPDVLAPAQYPPPQWDSVNLVYTASVTANVAVSSQLYITLASADLSSVSNIAQSSDLALHIPFAITFLPGPASNATSSLQASSALSGAVAGANATFVLTLRDASGNLITVQQSDAACQAPSSTCSLSSVTTALLSYPVYCAWSQSVQAMACQYQAFVADTYQLNLYVNGGVLLSVQSSQRLTVTAGAVSPSSCQVAFYSSSTGLQLPSNPLTVQAAVPVLVSVSTYDAYGNQQTNGLNAGVVAPYAQSTAFVAATAPSAGLSLTAFSTSNGFFINTASLTGQVTGA